jgi:gamma-glutamylputrescine oxidase
LPVSWTRRKGSIVAALSTPFWLDSPARRYPALAGDESVDVAVVGGGVTGLACARVLADAGLEVRVLEARRVGSGASGRNGGFVLRGLAPLYSSVRAPELWGLTDEGVEHFAEVAGESFRRVGHLHLVEEGELEDVRAEADALAEDGFAAEWLRREELPEVVRPHYVAGVFDRRAGVSEPGRWARGLGERAAAAGAAIAEETPAEALDGTSVVTNHGTVRAERVLLATDGYTGDLVPEVGALVQPARNQVVATAPLSARHFEAATSARGGMAYWQQTTDRRLVIGGWRDADLDAENTEEEAVTETVQHAIEAFLAQILGVLPPITHRWAGILGLTPDRLPLVGELPYRPGVWTALGYSGHGNVLALVCGEAVAWALLGEPDARLEPFSPGRFPALRPPS